MQRAVVSAGAYAPKSDQQGDELTDARSDGSARNLQAREAQVAIDEQPVETYVHDVGHGVV